MKHFILCFLTFRISIERAEVLLTLKASWLFISSLASLKVVLCFSSLIVRSVKVLFSSLLGVENTSDACMSIPFSTLGTFRSIISLKNILSP